MIARENGARSIGERLDELSPLRGISSQSWGVELYLKIEKGTEALTLAADRARRGGNFECWRDGSEVKDRNQAERDQLWRAGRDIQRKNNWRAIRSFSTEQLASNNSPMGRIKLSELVAAEKLGREEKSRGTTLGGRVTGPASARGVS